ncbi:MAG: glycosyltransferase [Deltaproteobacteria bacterium]|nr:glycosyltransferase [Deltaproteobacteria bacterium]
MGITGRAGIIVGPGNIAGNALFIAEALRSVGCKSKSIAFEQHPFKYSCDIDNLLWHPKRNSRLIRKLFVNRITKVIINDIIRTLVLIYVILNYRIIFFISTTSYIRGNYDLPILKILGKKIVVLFTGCPERNPNQGINQTNNSFCLNCNDKGKQEYCKCNQPLVKAKIIRKIEKYADVIFAHEHTAGYLLNPERVAIPYVISRSSILKEPLRKFKNPDKIIITHFPSNQILKGTRYVHHVIRMLEEEYGDKIIFYSKRLPHSEIIKKLENTHILIDQFSSAYGLLAVEGMANGCIVINGLSKWFLNSHPDAPNVNCEPGDLYSTLKVLLSNPEKMVFIAEKSLEYHRMYHSPEAVGEYYKRIFRDL